MQTILLPFFDDEASQIALRTACLAAKRFDSYIEGLFVEEMPQIIGGEGMTLPPEYLAQLDNERHQRAAAARSRFEAEARECGVPLGMLEPASRQAAAGWNEQEGQESRIVGEYGRLFDLIAIGRSDKLAAGGWEPTCEAALFESGRPVLVAGTETPEAIGETIVIAWNGSTETARTIALARPFLATASKVVVLAVADSMVPGPACEQVAAHLMRAGIAASSLTVQTLGRLPGEAILDEASVVGADLLIKGAYTHSRFRQLIFGGATRHILSAATLPVLMAH